MRFIDAATINGTLSFPVLVDALEAAHRRPKMAVEDTLLGPPEATYFVRNAVDAGRFMASKLVTRFPGNPERTGLPGTQAIVMLFDGADGRPLAALDGTALTCWRTAADSALGARLLARTEPETMLVVGAGEMARWLVRAHRAVRPSLGRVLVWNRGAGRAAAVAAALRDEGVPAEAVTDLPAATRVADLVTTCTASTEPLVHGADLKPGAHLDLVGSYRLDMREVDDAAIRRAQVYVDLHESGHDVGELQIPLGTGALAPEGIRGDLYDLVAGRAPRRGSDEAITLFKNAGGGHLDLMTAECVLALLDGTSTPADA